LKFYDVRLINASFNFISDIIRFNSQLRVLSLKVFDITSEELNNIFSSFKFNHKLKEFYLYECFKLNIKEIQEESINNFLENTSLELIIIEEYES
jgi:hypothetical protein